MSRKLKPWAQAEKVSAELSWSQIRELGDTVDGGRIELLVAQSSAHVSLENSKPVIVLLFGGVRFPELLLE